MSFKFKVIKKKEFTVDSVAHTHFTVAYKGRVFGLSTLRFEGVEFKLEGNSITVPCDCEISKKEQVDLEGVVSTFYDIVPKLELAIAAY